MNNFKNDLMLAMSICFSHGTANALIFGMACIQQKGLDGFIFWAVPNTLCMAIFGYLYHKHLLAPQAVENKWIKGFMLLFQAMMLVFQMKLMQSFLQPLVGVGSSYIISSCIALFFIVWMYFGGLTHSIITDNWQGGITLLFIAGAIVYCAFTGVDHYVIPQKNSPDWLWGIWTTAVYSAAIICDLQHWRRAERDVSSKAFYWASFIFGVMMVLIALLGCFKIPNEVRALLFIPVLGLATSTIDSIAVALHELGNKKIGTGFACGVCCLWWLFTSKTSFFNIWNLNGAIRITTALLIIAYSIWYFKFREK